MADIDDLKAAFEHEVGAVNARNLDAFSASLHEDMVGFMAFSPFPVEGKGARRQIFQTGSATHESITVMPINPHFRVIGTTGVVWSHLALALKPKDGPMTTVFVCYTGTAVKADGKWLVVAEHSSRLPSGT